MDRVYGEKSAARIAEANVLVVGAGGVGCELLKDLGISGFRHLTLVDLDTIDVSNLNRQFLFRREHVGESKAKTAATAVEKMLKGRCKVEAIVGNIKDPQFDTKFFSKFDVVLNALDNTEARRHVNRMCLAAKVPMVESGSTGYLGQVTVVVGGETECYDCLPKPAPKTYAVCTIRSTPEKPVHCIVWAKQLMELLFGAEDESNLLLDLDSTLNAPCSFAASGKKAFLEQACALVPMCLTQRSRMRLDDCVGTEQKLLVCLQHALCGEFSGMMWRNSVP